MKKIKIRKNVRKMYILILLLIICLSLFTLYKSSNSNNKNSFVKENIYEYNNKFSYTYDVSLLENEYITGENITNRNVYITNLIDKVNLDLVYNYKANQSSDIIYSYQVTGKLEAVYTKDGEEQKVWEKKDIILPMKELSNTSDSIDINEKVELNLNEKIQMIKSFQDDIGMQVKTKYTVLLETVTRTSILNQEVINVYSPAVIFDIGAKTTTVSENAENDVKPQVVTKMVHEVDKFTQAKNGVASCAIIISTILLIIIFIKTENNNTVRNEYKLELNKILKDCQEKIVEIESKIELDGQGIIDVKEFDEIIKVSEELFKPILYWNNDLDEESWFCVVGNTMTYRYILKR